MTTRPGSSRPIPPELPQVVLARHLPDSVQRDEQAGTFQRIRRGALVCEPAGPDRFDALERRALARIAACERQLRLPHVVSHESAAMLWGLPLVGDGKAVHIIQESAPHRRGAADVVRHHHRLAAEDVTSLGGVPVTTLERTVLDCASSLRAVDGLVIADAALRAGLDRQACLDRLDLWRGRRGAPKALAVLDLADAGAESPGESRMRHRFLRAGLPQPQTQVRIPTSAGDTWGDVGWREWRVIAEYDGRSKYTADGAAADAVLRERRREVLIERAGWRVLRVTAEDLRRPIQLLRALERLCPQAQVAALTPRRWLA